MNMELCIKDVYTSKTKCIQEYTPIKIIHLTNIIYNYIFGLNTCVCVYICIYTHTHTHLPM